MQRPYCFVVSIVPTGHFSRSLVAVLVSRPFCAHAAQNKTDLHGTKNQTK